jgi:hypothetical protein
MDLNLSKVYIVLGLTYHLSKVIGQVEMLINCNYANSKNQDYISTSMIIIQKLNLPSTHYCQYLEVIQFGIFFLKMDGVFAKIIKHLTNLNNQTLSIHLNSLV